MSSKIQVFVVSLIVFGLAVFLGCASIQDAITPCYISPTSLKYARAEPTTFLPFTTLWDAKRVNAKMDYIHLSNQTVDELQYKFLKGLGIVHMAAAQEFQSTIFSPTGPIGLLFPALAGGSLGTFLLSKPSDKKKIAELEKEVVKNGGNA